MKALELVWYPLDASFPRGYVLPRDSRIAFRAADRMARNKRFTEAELAAEYWQAEVRLADFMAGLKAPYATDDMDKLEAMDHLVDTICCFATLPNYDEVVS